MRIVWSMKSCYALVIHLCLEVHADEMAFVDISSEDDQHIRFLDYRIQTMPGVAGLFSPDPMEAHDMTSREHVETVIKSVTKAATTEGTVVANLVGNTMKNISALYKSLPKNDKGGLDAPAVRYAMSRYFIRQHGWSIKGLEPAGSSWMASLEMTADVRQTEKYCVAGWMLKVLSRMTGPEGFNIHWVAVAIIIVEFLTKTEAMSRIQDIYRALGLAMKGGQNKAEFDEIIEIYVLTHVFGTSLEISSKSQLANMRNFMGTKHFVWQAIGTIVQDALRNINGSDYEHVFSSIIGFERKYVGYQETDCTRARTILASPRNASVWRTSPSLPQESSAVGRRTLFVESSEELQSSGSMHKDNLMTPNYLESVHMCLPTASYYSICCPSPCDDKMELLETRIGSPFAGPDQIYDVLGHHQKNDVQYRVLKEIAALNGGQIALHSREFAFWLHGAFPLSCPAPLENMTRARIHPRTPSEWMLPPADSIDETDILINGYTTSLVRYIRTGVNVTPSEEEMRDLVRDSTAVEVGPDVEFLQATPSAKIRRNRGFRATMHLLMQAAAVVCMGVQIGRMIAQAAEASNNNFRSVSFPTTVVEDKTDFQEP